MLTREADVTRTDAPRELELGSDAGEDDETLPVMEVNPDVELPRNLGDAAMDPLLFGEGIMGDEHRLRRATMRQREVELEGRRVDARIASLESLATQATLLAGFSYAVLRPDSIKGLLLEGALTSIIIAACSATSFCAALWVVYLTGYSAIRARIAYLQGASRTAITDALDVLIETQSHARSYFDLSIELLVLSAVIVILNNMPLLPAAPLVFIFLAFSVHGLIHKRRIDRRLHPWTKGFVPNEESDTFTTWIDRLDTALGVAWLAARRACVRCMRASCHRLCPRWTDTLHEPSATIPAYSRRGAHMPSPSGGARGVPAVARGPSNSSHAGAVLGFRGWIFISGGTKGALRAKSAGRATTRRYAVFSPPSFLLAYGCQEHAELAPAKKYKRAIDLSFYRFVTVEPSDEGHAPFTFGLQAVLLRARPSAQLAAEPVLSFYIRCLDASSFSRLSRVVKAACAAAPPTAHPLQLGETAQRYVAQRAVVSEAAVAAAESHWAEDERSGHGACSAPARMLQGGAWASSGRSDPGAPAFYVRLPEP